MKNIVKSLLLAAAGVASASAYAQKTSGNPIFEGDYADPEGIVFGKTYWIYPTYSAAYEDQLFFDCFSSKDLVTWTKHERIIDNSRISWLRQALWAPAAVEKNGKMVTISKRFYGYVTFPNGEIWDFTKAKQRGGAIARKCGLFVKAEHQKMK